MKQHTYKIMEISMNDVMALILTLSFDRRASFVVHSISSISFVLINIENAICALFYMYDFSF